MPNQTPRYRVGIDLGTTHTVVAYSAITSPDKTDQGDIHIFAIPQLVAPGQVQAKPLLPSTRYHPADGELAAADVAFSPAGAEAVVGEAARLLGAKTKGRLVTSAKSWLSHPSVEHDAAILPWGGDEGVAKVSPIDASASYLQHIRTVWRHAFPDAPLEQQDLVITVPASFDEAARSLTVAAAKRAGLANLRLLEEPQAVCYDWLQRNASQLARRLASVRLLLVCDVGGGTTDLTLIKVEPGATEPKLSRIGVGDHLMLGGDNIDLALARLAESRLQGDSGRMSAAEFSQLLEQCRIAKERLLAEDAPEQAQVTLLGSGGKLIGGARSVALSREEVRQIALDGFFPLSGLEDLPERRRSGVVEFGLPYAAEPAVSKHIAAFLQRHRQAAQAALGGDGYVPDALLLNGGVFRSTPITERLVALLSAWRGQPPLLLDNRHPELAVAYGAVSYAIARHSKQLKIGGGAARSYFLLVDSDIGAGQRGVCLLPKGSEEGEEIILQNRQFALRLGVPVRFHLASTTGDSAYQPGDVAELGDDFQPLPPLAVALPSDGGGVEVAVQLAVTQTEMGTLKIQCLAVANPAQRWDVEFQLRGQNRPVAAEDLGVSAEQFQRVAEQIQLIFGAKSKQVDPKAIKTLRADLEKIMAKPRPEWPTPLLRSLFAVLLEHSKGKSRSDNHERIWLSLLGFCLRPGFGYALDDWRVAQVWKLYPQGVQFASEIQNWSEWWTLWRRVAGGLDQAAQERIFNDLRKYLNPASARQANIAKQLKSRSYDDMVRLAAALERLDVAQKIELGGWLLQRLTKRSEPEQTWWALGRVGARVPFHGGRHNVVPASVATQWLAQMLAEDWKNSPPCAFAATLVARMGGDRDQDIDETLRGQVISKLKTSKAPSSWVAMVTEVTVLDEKEERQMFGEALPPGLKLLGN